MIGILLPGAIIFSGVLLHNKWHELKTYRIFLGSLIVLLFAAPWHVLMQLKHPAFFHFYFVEQQFLRYFTDTAKRTQPIWFMPAMLLGGLFPWTGFLLMSVKSTLLGAMTDQPTQAKESLRYLVLWFSILFLFFWCSRSQLQAYILPMFPAAAILIGRYVNTLINQQRSTQALISLGIASVMSCAIGIAGIIIVHHQINRMIHPDFAMKTTLVSCAIAITFGVASILLYFLSSTKKAILSVIIFSSLLGISLNVTYGALNNKSIKLLANALKSQLNPSDIVVSYGYLQDLPVYLQRNVKVLGNFNEFYFGEKHQNTHHIIINKTTLLQWWHDPHKTVYFILPVSALHGYNKRNHNIFHIIHQTPRYALVTNKSNLNIP